MACGSCGKKKGSASFVYTSPKGQTTTYPTEIEARAAQIRNGGGQVTTVSR